MCKKNVNNNYMQNLYDEEPSADLISNGFKIDNDFDYSITLATLSVKTLKKSRELKKEIGEYKILNSPFFNTSDEEVFNYTRKILKEQLEILCESKKKVLVVGLGNEKIQADAFGSNCIDCLEIKDNIYAIKPDVYQNTNIMACDIILGVCKIIEPELVILIDSLGTYNIKRLACSFQVCNVGILPGGAIHKQNKIISEKTLGVPCVVIGVPLMVFSKGLDKNLDDFYGNLILTPKDIDEVVKRCAIMVSDIICELF